LSDVIKAEWLRVGGEVTVPAPSGTQGRRSPECDAPAAQAGEPLGVDGSVEADGGSLAGQPDVCRAIVAEAETEAAEIRAAARRESDALLAQARRQAEEIRAQAIREADALRVEAEHQGRAAGEEQARDQWTAILADLRDSLEALRDRATEEYARTLAEVEPEVVSLVLAIARRVLEAELHYAEEALPNMVAQSLARLRETRELRIRVSPGDLGRAEAIRHQLMTVLEGVDGIDIIPDPRVDGGAVIETPMGTIDASLSGQLREIEQAMAEAATPDRGADEPA